MDLHSEVIANVRYCWRLAVNSQDSNFECNAITQLKASHHVIALLHYRLLLMYC